MECNVRLFQSKKAVVQLAVAAQGTLRLLGFGRAPPPAGRPSGRREVQNHVNCPVSDLIVVKSSDVGRCGGAATWLISGARVQNDDRCRFASHFFSSC